MDLKVFDARNKDLTEISKSEVPDSIEDFLISHNKLANLDSDFFDSKTHLFNIDLSYNQFSSLQFLRCFCCIGFLDLSHNLLDIDDLFDIRNCVILRLILNHNNFEEAMYNDPLLIPTIVSHAWVVNGDFITDRQRQLFKNYESTLEYGNSILSSSRFRSTKPIYVSTAQAGKYYVNDHDLTSHHGTSFTPSLGAIPVQIDRQSQFDRLQYLTKFVTFEAPDGEFIDYLGASLGILCKLWIGEKMNLIPHLLCRNYWFGISEDLEKMENWELTVVLLLFFLKAKPAGSIETDIWNSVNVSRYLHTGVVPVPGATPRLILAAFISRSVAIYDDEPSDASTFDLRIYFRFRKICGFAKLETSLESVHTETISPFYQPRGMKVEKNDKIEFVHPLTNEWVSSTIARINKGRIYIMYDSNNKIPSVIVQIPVSSIFWDGRGVWREASKRGDSFATRDSPRNDKKKLGTFITETNKTENKQEPAVPELDLSFTATLTRTSPNVDSRPLSQRKSIFHEGILQPSSSRFSPKDSLLRSTTFFAQSDIEIDERKMMPGWRTFRGIVDVPFPKSQRSNRSSGFLVPCGNSIKDVVNVVNDNSYGKGNSIKKFNVKIHNDLTNKSKYVWVAEDQITKETAQKFNEMYTNHVANKMKSQIISYQPV